MVELLTAWAIDHAVGLAVGSVLVIFVTWFLKKIPTEKIRKLVYDFFYVVGSAVSKFFNNWKYTQSIWEHTLEPWLIGFLDMLFGAIITGLFDGLRSDNPPDKEE